MSGGAMEPKEAVPLLLAPVHRCVEFLAEEMKVGGTIKHALILTSSAGVLFDFATRGVKAMSTAENAPNPTKVLGALQTLRENTPSAFAGSETDGGFAVVHAHTLVSAWAALESAEQGLVMAALQALPGAVALAGVQPNQQDGTLSEEAAREAARWKLRAGDPVHRKALKKVGLDFNLEPATQRLLSEAGELRNCLLHRGRTIDEQAANRVPGLRAKIGQAIRISAKEIDGYLEAANEWAVALTGAVTARCLALLQ
jgi:hypothetical protein